MERIHNEPRRLRGLGASFALVFVLALGSVAVASAAGGTNETEEYVVVRHILYAGPNGEVISEEGGSMNVSAQFVVGEHLWGPDSLPVPVRYYASGAPDGLDVTNIIAEAIGTWNSAGSGFSFAWSGSSSDDMGACASQIALDGISTIRFVHLTGVTLGQTCTIYPVGAATKLMEFDLQLDADAQWSSSLPVPGDKYDLPTTVLHELGHAAGLAHSAESSAVMYFQVQAGESKRALMQDDIDGIRAAYPPAPTTQSTVPANYKVRAPQLSRD